jgi:hypothetical protein
MSGKVLKSALVVGTAASFAVLGGSADLADASRGPFRAKAPKLILAGSIRPAGDVAPGDRIERRIVLRLRGRAPLATVALTVQAKRASLLPDHRQGLLLTVDRCSKRWKRTARKHSYTCRGWRTRLCTRMPVLAGWRPSLTLRPGARAYLRLRLKLPIRAGNALQHQTSTLVYRFTGIAQS